MALGDGAVEQDGLRRAADARAAHLGVERDPPRLLQVRRAVHIDMAKAFQMADHGHPRLVQHPLDQPLPPRGTTTSTAPRMESMAPTAARSRVGTSWMQPSGRPAAASPS